MKLKDLITKDVEGRRETKSFQSAPYWKALRNTGTELWLDTGDIEEAESVWSAEMSALTTNNTLLNNEIQKGIYDELIREADSLLEGYKKKDKVREIAFILNAHHGLRLVQKFGGRVSIELHTDFADDYENTVSYARRFHEISPDNFLIKIPFTAEGLIATRTLEEEGIPINLTLGFSARQNYLAAQFARPSYVNVFLGRINSFFADNGLSDGSYIGEKTTISSQRWVHHSNRKTAGKTKQIAASMRNGNQIPLLAGVDVFTMPVKVTREGTENDVGELRSRIHDDYEVQLSEGVSKEEIKMEKLYNLREGEIEFIHSLNEHPPKNGEELTNIARAAGCADLFPKIDQSELETIQNDGKIPIYEHWSHKISKEETAIDTLLTFSAIATFQKDQAELDSRISSLIS